MLACLGALAVESVVRGTTRVWQLPVATAASVLALAGVRSLAGPALGSPAAADFLRDWKRARPAGPGGSTAQIRPSGRGL
jgi:hypothetical protein